MRKRFVVEVEGDELVDAGDVFAGFEPFTVLRRGFRVVRVSRA